MRFLVWLATKLLLGNIKRAIFPYIGATAGVAALVVAFSVGAGGEKLISNNLMAIGENRLMLGGDEFTLRDAKILENYPFTEYTIFPEAREEENGNIFIGYSKRALNKLKLSNLREREVIVDKNQFPEKNIGDTIEVTIKNRYYRFKIVDIYVEENPFELMKQGNRVLVSQEFFEKLFDRHSYHQVVLSLDREENAEDLIPLLLQKFNGDRNSYKKVRILETPEVYKKIVKIQSMVKTTLYALAFVSLILSGVGIMALISSGIKSRSAHIGILRAIGMEKKDVVKVFLIEGSIISILGTVTGVFVGVLGAILCGKLIMIPPVFHFGKILLAIVFSLVLGITLGMVPAKKAGELNVVDALKE